MPPNITEGRSSNHGLDRSGTPYPFEEVRPGSLTNVSPGQLRSNRRGKYRFDERELRNWFRLQPCADLQQSTARSGRNAFSVTATFALRVKANFFVITPQDATTPKMPKRAATSLMLSIAVKITLRKSSCGERK
jgi:hypothetical protein